MKPLDFRPVFAVHSTDARDSGSPAAALELEASRWWHRPAGKTNDDVRAFCEKMAERYGLTLVAIDMAQAGLGAVFGRFQRLRVTPRPVREMTQEFEGATM